MADRNEAGAESLCPCIFCVFPKLAGGQENKQAEDFHRVPHSCTQVVPPSTRTPQTTAAIPARRRGESRLPDNTQHSSATSLSPTRDFSVIHLPRAFDGPLWCCQFDVFSFPAVAGAGQQGSRAGGEEDQGQGGASCQAEHAHSTGLCSRWSFEIMTYRHRRNTSRVTHHGSCSMRSLLSSRQRGFVVFGGTKSVPRKLRKLVICVLNL